MDKKEYIKSKIRDIENFPKEGIIFKDITPLLMDPKGVEYVVDLLVNNLHGQQVDKVVGMESRGFFFGMLLAQRLGAGFVPVRKKGKLPYKTLSQTYDLEYGQDVLEIHEDAINPGEKILIHDDILATGGTAEAVVKLVEHLGGTIVQLDFLMELGFLKGREKLKGHPVSSIL
ncbi:MAG: adenine phosphoribosyltransferase [Capnocytophaga sp.]|uniref:adenine phosphoribosyltransferase n=1 Tax=Capnocytophaga sp. TaxID=44737 RepID=UPI003FA0F6D9